MNTGISLYFSSGIRQNEQMIKKAVEHGMKYAFTSLHIPEEMGADYPNDMKRLLHACKEGGLSLIADVGPETLAKLGVRSVEELADTGITHLRLDYGFSAEETARLSEKFYVVFNASTITREDLQAWRSAGADFTRFAACHNFYPKDFTGLAIERVRQINSRLSDLGFMTMAFVPGSKTLRGPLFEGLPTVEAHRERREEVLLNMLELFYDGECDAVLVGDVDVTEEDWKAVGALGKDYVSLRADIREEYAFVRDTVHHDRADSSSQVIRSQESRLYERRIPADRTAGEPRPAGAVFISNERYQRYMGELEIARVELPPEERVNRIGTIRQEDRKYLPYIKNGLGVRLL